MFGEMFSGQCEGPCFLRSPRLSCTSVKETQHVSERATTFLTSAGTNLFFLDVWYVLHLDLGDLVDVLHGYGAGDF